MPIPAQTIPSSAQFTSLFKRPLLKGKLIARYKRFFADVKLDTGEIVTAHCPNTGKMTGCAEPGFTAWVQPNDDPKRKLKYTLELVQNTQQQWIGVNTQRANNIVEAALQQGLISALPNIDDIAREVKYGQEQSKIDFLLTHTDGAQTFLEVKSVTLQKPNSTLGYFPDTVSTRAHKHCRELMHILNVQSSQPRRAVMLYLVQHTGIEQVSPATHIDPVYAQLVADAKLVGVEFIVYNCKINEENILINQELNFVR
jgi:sugar fermentation stimulation protein A